MAAPSVPADPGWGEDLAWLDRDPMSPAEREAWTTPAGRSYDTEPTRYPI